MQYRICSRLIFACDIAFRSDHAKVISQDLFNLCFSCFWNEQFEQWSHRHVQASTITLTNSNFNNLKAITWNRFFHTAETLSRNLSVRRCKSVSWCCWAWDKQKKRTLAWHVATPWAPRFSDSSGWSQKNYNRHGRRYKCCLEPKCYKTSHAKNDRLAMLSCKEWSIGHAILQAQMSTSMPDFGSERRTLLAAQRTSEAISCHQTCAATW